METSPFIEEHEEETAVPVDEVTEQRGQIRYTGDVFDQIKMHLALFMKDDGYIERKSLDGGALVKLLDRQVAEILTLSQSVPPTMPNIEDSAAHVLQELDPKYYEWCIDVCDQEGLTMAQLILGHIMKAQEQGELHAPMRDLTWAETERGPRAPTEYTCKQCGKTENGRRGQVFCGNECAAEWNRVHMPEEESQAQKIARPVSRAPVSRAPVSRAPVSKPNAVAV